MLPNRVLNPGPLTNESGALPIVLRGPACLLLKIIVETMGVYPYTLMERNCFQEGVSSFL